MGNDRYILTLETTCDETAAAIISDQLQVLGAAVATQHELHERFSGVVPEIASRAHVERILPVIDQALRQADLRLDQLSAVAVANTPGLAGSLLVGLSAAKALCVALDLPLLAINHLQAHIYACRLAAGRDIFPTVGLIVSGGHTSLYRCAGPLEFELLGSTIDDAAGEAFDKVASMLSLGYPGGSAIERVAREGNARAYSLPRSFMNDPGRLQFSFSGLKTAVRYQLAGQGSVDFSQLDIPRQQVADLAASFQQAVIDVLVQKSLAAVAQCGFSRLCVGGGVAANMPFREQLAAASAAAGVELIVAPPHLCTDNAVMGAIAIERLRAGEFEPLTLDAFPGPQRTH